MGVLDQVTQMKNQGISENEIVDKLREQGVNLLAGRALTLFLYPLTVRELGKDFNLSDAYFIGWMRDCIDTGCKRRRHRCHPETARSGGKYK